MNVCKQISDIDLVKTELDHPFTKSELLNGLKGLKNNKASSFGSVQVLHQQVFPDFGHY